ncbi:MAG: energy-coupling factor transporter ATPase, partial [Clostridia bacterium]|nr:energy-coupling factor transporter ATPase [Clostridia bacterium]
VILDGEDIFDKKTNLKAVRQKVGLVFQYPEYQLFEETVFQDVAFGPRNLGLPEDEIADRVKTALAMVELDFEQYKDLSPFELSGGQKRRLAIAGVLAMDPATLILDEPTAGLDPRTRDRILSMVEKWHAIGKTILMISHSMEDVARLADRIFVMNHGHLVMTDTPARVFSQLEKLKEMNLGVPQVTRLCYSLREAGFSIDSSIYTLDEMERVLIASLKGGTQDA